MARITPQYIKSLNFAIEVLDLARRAESDAKIVRKINTHMRHLHRLRGRVLYAISSPEFTFDSIINADYNYNEKGQRHPLPAKLKSS